MAELDGNPDISTNHLSAAIHYRSLYGVNWGG
nr:hypothetical protein [Bacteroidota bacterium]